MFRRFFNVTTYNIAEWIPFFRILAVPFIFATIFADARIYTGLLFLATFATDALDGFVARTYQLVTRRFAKLDSTGDVLMLLVGLYGFYYYETEFFLEHQLLIYGTVALYLLQQLISLLRFGKTTSFHTVSAKAAAVVQAFFITIVLVFGIVPWFFYLTVAISVLETLEEITILLLLRELKFNIKGLYWLLRENKNNGE